VSSLIHICVHFCFESEQDKYIIYHTIIHVYNCNPLALHRHNPPPFCLMRYSFFFLLLLDLFCISIDLGFALAIDYQLALLIFFELTLFGVFWSRGSQASWFFFLFSSGRVD